MTSTAGLKVSTLILSILIISCIVAGFNQFLAAGGLFLNRYIIFQATFFLYFASSLLLIRLTYKKLSPELVLAFVFIPMAVLTIKGLLTSWSVLYPYHFPLQTIIVISAEIIVYVTYEIGLRKQVAIYFLSGLLLFAMCFITINDPLIEVYKDNKFLTSDVPPNQGLYTLKEQLIDSSGKKLILNDENYYILNFSYSTSAACQIKLQYLKKFARQAPAKLKVIYIANAKMETFYEFKSKLKADKNDNIIYAYLYDDKLLKKLEVAKYPGEILVGPGFKFLRKQDGFYSFDADTYAGSTLKLISR